MFDPRYHAYSAELAGLRRGGTRRFYTDGAPRRRVRAPARRRRSRDPAVGDVHRSRPMRRAERASGCGGRCATATASSRGSRGARSGTNVADGPIELVWETTYASVGAYATTYMTHPYHAALLDRFLLPDCPERITTTNDFGAGLIGYTVDRDRPLGPVAIRRILLLDFARSDAPTDGVPRVDVPDDGWSDSIVAENTMATRWFDGETDLGGRPGGATSGTSASPPSTSTRRTAGAPAGPPPSRPALVRGPSGAPRSSTCPRSAETSHAPTVRGWLAEELGIAPVPESTVVDVDAVRAPVPVCRRLVE